MPICNFIQANNHRACQVECGDHAHCGVHTRIALALGPVRPGGCEHYMTNPYHWCSRTVVPTHRLCPAHLARREREARADRGLREAIAAARVVEEDFRREIRGIEAAAQRARAVPPPPRPELQRLAEDRQNVHTAAVNRQTKEGEERLLATPTDGRQVGLRILRVFASRAGTLRDVMYVMNDVNDWYSRTTIREPGDRLYGRLLEGLWVLIDSQPSAVKSELINRLWQEMAESVNMCSEGHISRLINVMVGFDDSFKPPVSLGDVLQTKIAAIAAMDIPVTGKLSQARTLMTELGLSPSEQAPWLEALE